MITEKLLLEEILGCDPLHTYLGGGYKGDICRFTNVQISLQQQPSIEGHLIFDRSALAESSQGFHLSAVNVQFLVPKLSLELAKRVTVQEGCSIQELLLQTSVQNYDKYVFSMKDITGLVCLAGSQGKNFQFAYEFNTPQLGKAFHGMMQFQAKYSPSVSEELLSTEFGPISCTSSYALRDVLFYPEDNSMQAVLTSEKMLEPAHIHGAVGQLMRALYCRLFGFNRQKIIDARAYKITQEQYGKPLCAADVEIKVDKNLQIKTRPDADWAFTTCDYNIRDSLNENGLKGTIQVACPMKEWGEEQYKTLKTNFTVFRKI